ncbi:alpha/beta hydrolase family protein [Dictyobacter kobayashii]|uniref:BD-FAE-like domain-containing protein n=1 Tax=Dictyobacter kobayashii TaxID=2014872 RepID=A0A402AXS7_9CHLR|nr:alpha/beta hydrolase [Dictyobacter kobayashii]GCE23922.1 hypothetical protein KDK_77220 [Dictyobacter kobayashii]
MDVPSKRHKHGPVSAFHKLAYGPDPLQYGELYLPEGSGPYPVVQLIHGGFWRNAYDLTLMQGLAKNLVQHGIAAWNIEYRRVGDPGGAWPGTLLDVASATDHLNTLAPTYKLDLQRVVAVGHSAGGHLAFWLAGRHRLSPNSPLRTASTPLRLKGAISQAGVVDLEQAWQLHLGQGAVQELLQASLTKKPERYAEASPAALLPLGIPQVLIHGGADDRVPLKISQGYAQKARAAGDHVRLIELAGADHFVLIDPTSDAWQLTVEEIMLLLG